MKRWDRKGGAEAMKQEKDLKHVKHRVSGDERTRRRCRNRSSAMSSDISDLYLVTTQTVNKTLTTK